MRAQLRSLARMLVRRSDFERSMRDEMQAHREMYAEALVAQGLPPVEAARRAAIEFGSVPAAEEDCREARGVRLVDELQQDLRYAARQLVRAPGFTAAVVGSLALGIGVNAAMFGVVDRLFLRDPAYLRDAASVNRVYFAWNAADGTRIIQKVMEYPRFLQMQRWTERTSSIAVFANRPVAVGDGVDTRKETIAAVSANFFDFFDARPLIGRFFTAAEDQLPAGQPVAVISFDYWQHRFASMRSAIGARLHFGTAVYTVIGVAPRGFDGIADQDVPIAFLPATAYGASVRSNYATRFNWDWVNILIRRRPGVSVRAATTDLTAAFTRSWDVLHTGNPGGTPAVRVARPTATAAPLQLARGPLAGPEARVMLWVAGVALVVLLVACANVANLLLARGVRRQREIAVRRSMGGTTFRLVRQLLTETLLMAALATAVGIVAAAIATNALRGLFVDTEQRWRVATDVRTLVFAALLTLVASLLAGLVPAFHASRGRIADVLGAGMREAAYRRSRGRSALLILQTAVSLILLVGGGLFLESLEQVRAIRLGFDADSLIFAWPTMRSTLLDSAHAIALNARLLAAARATPGVTAATPATTIPFAGGERRTLYVPGIDSVQRLGTFQLQYGSEAYFRTLGTRILRGRGIDVGDAATAPRVAVVSDAMAKVLWKDADPLGQCFRIADPNGPCVTVVGVAENIHTSDFTSNAEFTYYLPFAQYVAQFSSEGGLLLVRSSRSPALVVESLRRALQREMPGDAYVNVQPLRSFVDPQMRSWLAGTRLFLAFGALALFVGAMGLYAVIAFDVVQRTPELGIRTALGARPADLVRLVVGEGLRVTAIGVALGVIGALATAPAIGGLLFRVSSRDPMVFGVVAATLGVASVIATLVPAARAARTDPSIALRFG
jgi:putative ABC transport system permease protein